MMFLINYWLFPFEKIDSLGYDFHKRISVSFFFQFVVQGGIPLGF